MKEILLQGDCIMNGFGEWILSVNYQFKMLTWQMSSYSNGNGKLYLMTANLFIIEGETNI